MSLGQHNFAQIRYEYFRDRQVGFEAFKGGAFTYRQEFTARVWATGYDFPAVREGRVKREELPDDSPPNIQAWYLNPRRAVFKDPRVREAIGLCFDFPWTNRSSMYGAYTRTSSFFEKSDLMASGPPSAEELALLEPLRDKLSPQLVADVFGEPYAPPAADGSGQDRTLLARAVALLKEAGCTREGGTVRLPGGAPLEFEFLDNDPIWEPVAQPFIKNLGLIGIRARQRNVDASQYQARLRDFDFDVTARATGADPTPGPEIREAFGSRGGGGPAGRPPPRGGRAPRLEQPRRDRRAGGRRAARHDRHRRLAGRAHDCLPRARPGAAGRSLLDPDVVLAELPARGLGRVRPPGQATEIRARRARSVVVRRGQGPPDRARLRSLGA